MNNIWANRLIAETQFWDDVPTSRKDSVRAILKERVKRGEITGEKFEKITGEAYAE